MLEAVVGLVSALIGGAFAAGGAYWAFKIHLQWLRADVARLDGDVTRLDKHVAELLRVKHEH